MKRLRLILIISGLGLLLVIAWVLWSRPRTVDMAAYAPADSLLYLEMNDPMAVVETLVATDAWRLMNAAEIKGSTSRQKGWLSQFLRITGIGPVQSVILSRAQVAVAVTDLGAREDGDTLTVKPEVALIIETHTSEARIRNTAEHAVKALAESTYTNPTLRRTVINGVEFVEWRNSEGSRQIVFSTVGSLIVVGNSEKAVQRCLESAGRRSPSLQKDANLQRLRRELAGPNPLTFGYVPQEKSPHLLAVAVPLLLGRAPGDGGFQKIVTAGAAKMFGSIAWSSQSFKNGIEDRYLISLQPSFLRQLQASLRSGSQSVWGQTLLPANAYSATFYKLQDPFQAWDGLRTAVSSNIDALSAVVFSSLLKSALVSYGISEPEPFLRAVTGEIVTIRLGAEGEHSLVIAGIKDRVALREVITKAMKFKMEAQAGDSTFGEVFVDPQGETAVGLRNDVVVIGTVSDLRRYSDKTTLPTTNDKQFQRITFYTPLSDSGPIVTYTDDSERVRRFISAFNSLSGSPNREPANFEDSLTRLPYAATQTRLVERGLERTTRSPLGQFSTLLPLMVPTEPRRP